MFLEEILKSYREPEARSADSPASDLSGLARRHLYPTG